MPEDAISTNKLVVMMLTTALASSGTTLGVKHYISPEVDSELIHSVRQLSKNMELFAIDPNSRADPWTGTQAREANERLENITLIISKRQSIDAKNLSDGIQALRDMMVVDKIGLRQLQVKIASYEKRSDKVEDFLTMLNQRLNAHQQIMQHEGSVQRDISQENRLDKLESGK